MSNGSNRTRRLNLASRKGWAHHLSEVSLSKEIFVYGTNPFIRDPKYNGNSTYLMQH